MTDMKANPSRNELSSEPVSGERLSKAQIDRWRAAGAILVHDLIPEELLQKLANEAHEHFPAPGTEEAAKFQNFGSEQRFVFPAPSAAFNQVTLHSRLLQAVADLLDVTVEGLRLSQSDLWPKYGRKPSTHDNSNADQRMHCDYPNHMLVHPTPWHRPVAVEMIVYLSDSRECGGGTAVVPRTGDDDPAYPWPIVQTPGVGGLRYVNDRVRAEAYLEQTDPQAAAFRELLYAREELAQYRFGSVLLYRHDAWHRGTPLKEGTLRLAQNLTFRRADCEWVATLHPGWAWSMYRPDQFMEKLIASSSPEQRAVLGFPAPGADYWCPQTIDAVEARYAAHGIDMAPYRAQL